MIYGNADGFKDYFIARGKELSAEWTDEQIESALLVSSEWLDNQYEPLWIGYKTEGFKQERSWPRKSARVQTFPYYLFANDEIPEQVVKAVYEATFRELTTPGYLQSDYTPNKYSSVRVEGAIAVEYNKHILYASDAQNEIPVIGDLMKPLIDNEKGGNFSILSGRASRV